MYALTGGTRRALLTLIVASALAGPGYVAKSFAFDENSPAAINVDQAGVALQGYDPVSYFSFTDPTKGNAGY